MAPFYRRGTAGAYTYVCTVRLAKDGWEWQGHKHPTAGEPADVFGPVAASGGPYKTNEEADKAADRWFFSIPGIVEERHR